MSNSTILDFILIVEEYLTAPMFAAYWTFYFYAFDFHFDVSPHYLILGRALGAEEVFNDH